MNYIENTYICLAAPLLLSIFILRREARSAMLFLLCGMTVCLISAYVSGFFSGLLDTELDTASFELSPVVEEIMKALPMLFYLLVFEPNKKQAFTGTLMIAVGFATFENVCFLTAYGTADLLRLVIRGFGTGAMHVLCGMTVAIGLFFLWDQVWLQTVGGFALLCFVISIHALFNLFVNQNGVVFWIGSVIPLTAVLFYLLVFRKQIDQS